jgi:hypothetical protein
MFKDKQNVLLLIIVILAGWNILTTSRIKTDINGYKDKIESIQEDRGFAAERLTRMVDAGIITPNEAREELGYSRKDGGDELGRQLSTPAQEQPQAGDVNEQP